MTREFVLRAGPERSHMRDATLLEGMRAEAIGVQTVQRAGTLHLLPHGSAGKTHLVTVGLAVIEQLLGTLCLSVDYKPCQIVEEQTLLDCRAADLLLPRQLPFSKQLQLNKAYTCKSTHKAYKYLRTYVQLYVRTLT